MGREVVQILIKGGTLCLGVCEVEACSQKTVMRKDGLCWNHAKPLKLHGLILLIILEA